jgi:hypothetical protein
MTDKFNAIHSLRPTCGFGIKEDGSVDWFETNSQERPTDAEIDAEIVRLQAEYDAKDYQRKRKSEYPPMTDYLDGIAKGDQAQIDKYIADCQAVKVKYPKVA